MPTQINTKAITIALAGNPNSGKTTLFNQLTGLRQKVANYPGVTVEKKLGTVRLDGNDIDILDLPGTYALSPKSEEERIAAQIIQGTMPGVPTLNGILCVVDSTCLERSLSLVLQIIETKTPTAVLLNMSDELKNRGAEIDTEALSKQLGVPVISISALTGLGRREIFDLMANWAKNAVLENWPAAGSQAIANNGNDVYRTITLQRAHAKEICKTVIKKSPNPPTGSDRIDRVVMHRIWGPVIFSGVVLVVFQSIFTFAQPFMDLIDNGFGMAGDAIKNILPPGHLNSFISDGIIAGVGSVIVFLPQILILFFFIAILEHSGYMARAAMTMDLLMRKVGLQGKSFLPLVSSYACAVPGIMAARTIENKRDRIATIFVAPFMTCSARLPVYTLLIAAFVPNIPVLGNFLGLRALTLLGLYILGFGAAIFTAWILKSSVLKSEGTPFILDIPPYRRPSFKTIFLLMWDRSKIFLKRAGTIIMVTTIILWALISFPQTNTPEPLKNSFAGRFGVAIEPLIEPLGFNWKIGVGLLAAQAAREVIVSSLSTIYEIEGAENKDKNLQSALKKDLSPLGAISLMIFFVFAMQCMSTMAIARRELGGWKIPIIMFIYMNGLAYLSSLVFFQTGKWFGWG